MIVLKFVAPALIGVLLIGCTGIAMHPNPSVLPALPIQNLSATDTLRANAFFAPHAETSDLSGTLLVMKTGEASSRHYFGWADWVRQEPHTSNTQYHAASITKSLTAAAVISLRRDGILSLNDPVSRWLPKFAPHPEITIEAVLRHRAGLPRDLPDDFDPARTSVANWLTADPSRISETGKERYSNAGYGLIAEVLEAASGQQFAALIQDRVLTPARMNNSYIRTEARASAENLALPYTAGPEPHGIMTPVPALEPAGAIGLVTTPDDLAIWVRGLADGSYPELFKGADPLGSVDTGSDALGRYVSVQGALPGYVANAIAWEDGSTVSFMGNLFSYPALDMTRRLRIFVGNDEPPEIFSRPQEVTVAESHLLLAGEHNLQGFGRVQILPNAGGPGLILTMPDRPAFWNFYLTPISGGAVHWRAFDRILTIDDAGELTSEARADWIAQASR